MRTGWLTVIACIAMFFTAAAQEVSPQKITVSFHNDNLTGCLDKITAQTSLRFYYEGDALKQVAKKYTASYTDQSLPVVLDALFAGTGFTWQEVNHKIVIKQVAQKTPNRPSTPAGGHTGVLKGRVVDYETSQPLPGATLQVAGSSIGTAADDKGYYNLKDIPEGKQEVLVTYVGYQQNRLAGVMINSGKENVLDIRMQAGASLSGVEVHGGARKVKAVTHTTDEELTQEIKRASSIVSGISNEQISRSADRNAAEVVRRVSGIVLQDDKFVISRGMDPRYNLTYLNDNVAPSTELYSRSFALDLIPSRIIDRILVYKSPAPDLMGDMTSGAVKIYTKDAKNVKHLDIELQLGYRQGTTFNQHFLTYQGGKYDFLGFDDGTRKLPGTVPPLGSLQQANISQHSYVQSFSPILQYGEKTALPNGQLTINYYNSFPIGKHSLYSLTSLNYKSESQQNDVYRWQYGSNGKIYYETQGTANAQLNLLQNFTLHLHDSSNIQFKNFVLQQGQNTTITRIGQPTFGALVSADMDVLVKAGNYNFTKDNILSFSQRFLYAGNLGGTHYFNSGLQHLQWNIGYSYSKQYIPDQRAIHLINQAGNDPENGGGDFNQSWGALVRGTGEGTGEVPIDNLLNFGDISRIWIRDIDKVYNASVDYDWKLKPWMVLKAGTFQQWKQKTFFRRVYLVNDGNLNGSYTDLITYPGQGGYVDFNVIGFKEQDLGKLWSDQYLRDNGSGLKVYDKTNGSDAYIGTEQNNSGYVALSLLPPGSNLDIYGGLRVEYDRQKIAAAIPPAFSSGVGQVNIPILVDAPKTSLLPSVNISYRPMEAWVFRGAYGRTVNRPEFREIAPYTDIDYVNNQYVTGNPNLRSASIDNIDVRAEYYPGHNKKGEMISIGAFYKSLQNPIERIVSTTTFNFSTPYISYENATKAKVKGVELDVRKTFDFIPGKFFSDLAIVANAVFINSSVESVSSGNVTTDSVTTVIRKVNYKRPLQGQAPYIINAGLVYDNAGSGTRFSLNYNVAGARIYAASTGYQANGGIDGASGSGAAFRGSFIELPRQQLDLALSQRLVKTLQVKVSIQNILNQPVQMVEDDNYTWKYEPFRITTPPVYNPNGTIATQATATGDHIASSFNPHQYYVLSLDYAF